MEATDGAPQRGISDAARVAYAGYWRSAEDLPADAELPEDEIPSLEDAVANRIGDTLAAFLLVELTEGAEHIQGRASNATHRSRMFHTGISLIDRAVRDLQGARIALELQSRIEDVLAERPGRFAAQWRHLLRADVGGALECLERATEVQARKLAPDDLIPLVNSSRAEVRARALLLTHRVRPSETAGSQAAPRPGQRRARR